MTVPGIAKLTSVRNSNARRPTNAMARDDVRGQQADERGQRRGDGRDLHGVEQAVPRRAGPLQAVLPPIDAEAGAEVVERQRHVAASDVLDEAADEDDDVADDREHDPRGGDPEAAEPQAARQLRRHAAVALAADRHVRRPAEPALLQPERDEREPEQHRGQHRSAARVVLRAGDGEEDLRRQHVVVAGEHDRVAEVGEALDEAEQERGRERRPQQRPGHRPEHAAARGAQRLRRFLERGADRAERAVQDHERDRREREELRDRHAGQAVDPARARNAERARASR